MSSVSRSVLVAEQLELTQPPEEVMADSGYGSLDPALAEMQIKAYGYRWIRLRYTP
ncbi:MAG: hypothetical protein WAW53_11015 [Candidatus Dormiibacterota bacterium]